MSWESRKNGGRYYTRSRRVNGSIVREYVGTGPLAEISAELDEFERECRAEQREADRLIREQQTELDLQSKSYADLVDMIARISLVAGGCYQHNRGTWRKRNDGRKTRDG